jgi:stearoyl-CoA desaturase (delta-9 desaturase)
VGSSTPTSATSALPDEPGPMSPVHKALNAVVVVGPFLGFVTALALLWRDFVGWTNLAILAVGYGLTGLGVTVGFHRLLTHRSFKTWPAIRYLFAILGSMAIEGPVITWVADHRKHHQFSDREGDPHSPHVGHGTGVGAIVRGLAHAHVGWMFSSAGRAHQRRYAPDLLSDRGLRIISRLFPLYVVASFLVPFALGYALTGRLVGALTALLWGGLVRIFLLHHVTFSINSICHFWGKRRFRVTDESRNVSWLALFSFGEAWHHNHHAFPTSAFHGLRRWEIDPSGLVIAALERVGLAWDVTRIPPERQAAKELSPAGA